MYEVIMPLLYSDVTLSRRNQERLFRGIWESGKAKQEVVVVVQDVELEQRSGLWTRLHQKMGTAKRGVTRSKSRQSTVSETLYPFDPPMLDRKLENFKHTTTLTIQTLPGKEMIYRLYDLIQNRVSRQSLFPNLRRLVITGEAAWQWETDPAYQRGRQTFISVLHFFGTYKELCVYHDDIIRGKAQYLGVHPVYQAPLDEDIIDLSPQKTMAKHIRLNMDFIPPGLECVTFHNVVAQRLSIPAGVRTARIYFAPCDCGKAIEHPPGACPAHVYWNERVEQVRQILKTASSCVEGGLLVEIIDAENVIGSPGGEQAKNRLEQIAHGVQGIWKGNVRFLSGAEAGPCGCIQVEG
jgi:hypothetical protein